MPVLDNDGVRLAYEVLGEGPPLLLAHGYAASRAMWRHQLPLLTARYRVITFDARGHGESDAPEGARHYCLRQLVADLHALIEAIDPEPVHLVGHSMGGATVAAYAAAHPQRVRSCAICNIDAGHQRWTAEQQREDASLRQWKLDHAREHGMESLGREQLERDLAPAFIAADADQRAAFIERYRGQPLHGYVGVGEALPWRETWLEDAALGIRGPVCIIAGSADVLHTGARRLHHALPGSQFVLIDGAPHDSMNAAPEVFNAALLDFLDGVDARPGAAST